jgi:hypothetical protein
MEERLQAGDVLNRTFALVGANLSGVLLTILLLAGLGTALDVYAGTDTGSAGLPMTIVMLIAQYETTHRVLSNAGLLGDGYAGRRFLALLGLSILSSLGIVVGLVFLILPGIYLAVRWSIAVPVLIGEGAGVTEALGGSWQRTQRHALPILLVFLAIFFPAFLVAMIVGVFEEFGYLTSLLASAAILNVTVYVATVLCWYASVAIYAALTPSTDRLEEVFA